MVLLRPDAPRSSCTVPATLKVAKLVLIRIRIQHSSQLLALLEQLRRVLLEYVREYVLDRRLPLLLRLGERLEHVPAHLRPERRLLVGAPPLLCVEPLAEAGDGVVSALPLLDIDFGPVRKGVVGRGVVRDTIRHRFDEHRFLLLGGDLARGLGGYVHRHYVVPVHADRCEPVPHAAGGDPVALVLFQRRSGDGVAVVAADEDHRTVARGRHVESGVEVAFGCGALAEVADDNVARVFELQGVGGADSVGDLRGEGGGNGVLARASALSAERRKRPDRTRCRRSLM